MGGVNGIEVGARAGVASSGGTVGAGANALHAATASKINNGMDLQIAFMVFLRPTSFPMRFHRAGSGAEYNGCACHPSLETLSVFAAMMKSLRCKPLILCVHQVTVTLPHSVRIVG